MGTTGFAPKVPLALKRRILHQKSGKSSIGKTNGFIVIFYTFLGGLRLPNHFQVTTSSTVGSATRIRFRMPYAISAPEDG